MRFSTLSLSAVACFTYNTVASPIAEPLSVELVERQIGAGSCAGPIVNFFGYTAQGCTNAGSTSQLFNNLKFDPIPTDLDKVYYSSCSRINTPTDTAQSFAFTSDGFNLPNCYLDTFGTDDCTGPSRNQALRSGFSRCINETVGSVNVFCLPAGTFNPRDVEDPVVGDDTEGQVAHWSTRE